MKLERTLSVARLLDAETGIITHIEFHKPRHNDPQFVHCHANITDTNRLTGGLKIPGTGGTALTGMSPWLGDRIGRALLARVHDPQSIIVAPCAK
jgi:hypothetical protein